MYLRLDVARLLSELVERALSSLPNSIVFLLLISSILLFLDQ